jgi:hypothetical protein
MLNVTFCSLGLLDQLFITLSLKNVQEVDPDKAPKGRLYNLNLGTLESEQMGQETTPVFFGQSESKGVILNG